MKVCVISMGSRGDCVPMLVIAKELERRGHEVRLLINDSDDKFVPRSEIPNIDKRPLAGDFDKIVDDDATVEFFKSNNLKKIYEGLVAIIGKFLPEHTEQIMAAAEGMDMLVVNPIMRALTVSVGEKLRIPVVTVVLQPTIRSSDEPIGVVSATPFKFKWVNRLTWGLASRGEYKSFIGPLVNPWRVSIGLPPIPSKRLCGSVHLFERHPLPMICSFSPELSPLPSCVATTGSAAVAADYPFSFKDDAKVEENFKPSEDLSAFLNDEEKPMPIYIGWGSMNAGDPRMASELAFRALRISGARAVIHRGFARVSVDALDSALPDHDEVRAYAEQNSIEVDFVPHSWLYPRCAAAVHHGGSGTTHATLRAGIPAIITPFAFDQPYWQYRCHVAGVGPLAPRFWDISAQQLGDLIKSTLANEEMRARAADMGTRMRGKQDGATLAALAIEASQANTEMWTKFYDNGGITGDDCWHDEE